MAKMELTDEQWQKLYQNLPEAENFLFSLLPDLTNVFDAVKHGMVLTSRILLYFLETDKSPLIPKLIVAARNHDKSVFEFMKTAQGEFEAAKFIIDNGLHDLYSELSVECLVKYQQWPELAARKQFKLLADNQQYDLLEKYGCYRLLARYDQMERVINSGNAGVLSLTDIGMEKLAENGLWEEFYGGKDSLFFNEYTEEKILNTLWDNHQQNLLFKHQEDEFLLKKGWFQPYQKDELWATIVSYGYADEVDWEAYLTKTPGYCRQNVFRDAEKHRVWPFLAKHRKHWRLLVNGQFVWWLKSFFC